MRWFWPRRSQVILLLGDALMIDLLILIGFRYHNIDETAGPRLFLNWLSFFFAWLLVASALRFYDPRWTARRGDLWRAFPVAGLAALLGTLLRAPLLDTTINPLFVLVMAAVIAVGLFLWRSLYVFLLAPRLNLNG
ncbi:MAG: DUF3054 domain-containing protein [Anaerolineales bacterium]